MQKHNRAISCLLALALVLSLGTSALAADDPKALDAVVTDAGKFMYETVADPQVGSIGGEWAILGLARSGCKVPDAYYRKYYAAVEKYVADCKGKLHDKKYTEYSRLIVALTAIGKDPRSVGGYDLTLALGDYDKTIWQGMNGPIWALLALDSGNYPVPQNPAAKTQATRERYIQRILDCQMKDGGWSLFGGSASAGDGKSDPDITGMALQALAKYQDKPEVKRATEEALTCMSKQQEGDGGFSSWGTPNSESCVQMLVALGELGISPEDERFVKNGNTLLDNLMTFYRPGEGFGHTADGSGSNQMAAEQGFYGVVAVQRLRDGKNSLYRMDDALQISDAADTKPAKGAGLAGKHADVKVPAVTAPAATFPDVKAHASRTAIETLAARSILVGKDTGRFDPDATMTRAEFASAVVKALGLPPKAGEGFTDVPHDAWYAPVVGTAHAYGIVTGIDKTHFNPLGTITRQEAAVMVARAARLCGMDTTLDAATARSVLAQFTDYTQSAQWARVPLAFCYRASIVPSAEGSILPTREIGRGEIAQMIFNLLGTANLL